MRIFEDVGIEPIINASGAVTRRGGAPMPQTVLDAFCAEAGIVTSGAAAALTLGATAILARYDLCRIERLPQCDFPCEFIRHYSASY